MAVCNIKLSVAEITCSSRNVLLTLDLFSREVQNTCLTSLNNKVTLLICTLAVLLAEFQSVPQLLDTQPYLGYST